MTQRILPSITVIVCTRDRPALLDQCLRALSKQSYRRFDIVVVDNASSEPIQEICRRWGAASILAPLPGLTRARNVGARFATGDLIAYIDDDAVAEAGWLDALVAEFEDPDVGAVTGRIRYMKAEGDSRAMSNETVSNTVMRGRRSIDRNTPDWFALACFGGMGDGGNMAFRRQLIASLHPFDERLGCGRILDRGDEHALFASLITGGYRIVHNPEATVRHPSPPTAELQRARRINDLRAAVAFLLFLWGEFPAQRTAILSFLLHAVRKRINRIVRGHPVAGVLSRLETMQTMIGGVALFWRARREWNASPQITHHEREAPPSVEGAKARAASR